MEWTSYNLWKEHATVIVLYGKEGYGNGKIRSKCLKVNNYEERRNFSHSEINILIESQGHLKYFTLEPELIKGK